MLPKLSFFVKSQNCFVSKMFHAVVMELRKRLGWPKLFVKRWFKVGIVQMLLENSIKRFCIGGW